jgi:hypothetical protein
VVPRSISVGLDGRDRTSLRQHDLYPDLLSGQHHPLHLGWMRHVIRIQQHTQPGQLRHGGLEQLELLRAEIGGSVGEAGEVFPSPKRASIETFFPST